MINLSTPIQQAHLKRIYQIRRAVVALWLTLALIVVGLVLELSLYIILVIREQSLTEQLSQIKTTEDGRELNQIQMEVRQINQAIKVARANEPVLITSVVTTLINLKLTGVSLEKITYEPAAKSGVLGGVASSRRQLVALVDKLRRDEQIASVEMPLSGVISDGQNQFTINFTLK